MFKRTIGFGLAATLIAVAGAFLLSPATANAGDGAKLTIHNNTKVAVEVYVFEDDSVHTERGKGLHSGDLAPGEAGSAVVKACHFAVVLFEKGKPNGAAHHKEFHDCSITDISIE